MRIISDTKLDYSDVLLCPKRSTLHSRKNVDITREFIFLHSKAKWKGIPIVASNMDTVGTTDAAKVLSRHNLLTFLHKFHTLKQLNEIKNTRFWKNCVVTIGIRKEEKKTWIPLSKKQNLNSFALI